MKKAALVALSLVALLTWTAIQSDALLAQVYINEVVASNSSGLADEEGDFPDWIELYNYSDSTISLEGYGISDDSLDLFKFTFPEFIIEPGEYYILFASDKDTTGQLFDWTNVITQGDSTKYIIPESSIDESWITNEFNDSTWQDGRFGIGYGDGDDITNVPNGTISVFTRTSFNIANKDLVNGLLMKVDFDDGYVAYLNGTEVHRENINGQAPLPYNATAITFTEPMLDQGLELPELNLNEYVGLLNEGKNTLAIQIHNSGSGSSDMTLIPFLDLGSSTETHHLNFKLSSGGEELFLSSPDSTVIDYLAFPELKTGESYGRSADNDSLLYIFLQPSPRSANSETGYIGRSAEPELDKVGGFYSGQLTLSLADTSMGEDIRFTWDGSDPNINSLQFGSDIRTLSKTFTLKFRTFEQGKLPSNIVTYTYFKEEDHELPVVSLSTNPINLWSNESGIYVIGANGSGGNCIEQKGVNAANWNQDWEIPVTIELYEKDKSRAFISGAGAKIFGGCSRLNPAKSLAIYFRDEYGNSELDYKLFEEKDIDKFQAFVLRNSGNDFGFSMIRDGLMKTLMEGSALDYQAFRPAVLYINGEYWGIHNIREKINEHFIESNSDADSEDIDLLEGQGWAIHGDTEAYNEFLDALGSADMSNVNEYQGVEDKIDIDNYTDYMAAEIYYANTDWPGNNIKYWRNRKTNGKWRWILYDTDFGFNLYDYNVVQNTIDFALNPNGPGWPNPPWSTYIFRQMVQSDIFVQKFVNRMSDLMNTRFEAEFVNSVIDSLSGLIESEIPRHVTTEHNGETWGSGVTTWTNNLSTIRDFADKRRAYMETFIRERFDLSLPRSIEVDVSDPEQGSVKVNRVTPDNYPWSGKYFGGLKVPVTAIPKPGYKFIGWSGDSESTEHTIMVDPGSSLSASFEPSNGEEATIVINEIMHSGSEAFDSGDWIELYNATGYEIDLSGWILKDNDDGHEYIFPNGSELEPGAYLVVADNLDDFNGSYNKINPLYGELGFGLSSGGDQVRLYNDTGLLIDSVQYLGESPWPVGAVGTGYSMELDDPDSDNTEAENWVVSLTVGGTPGTENGVIVANEDENELPSEFQLDQNYPNPFNPSTRISYEIPVNSKVTLKVFDMLGRQVATLVDGWQSAGSYSVTFDAKAQASGVYIYLLETGGITLSKRMVLIK